MIPLASLSKCSPPDAGGQSSKRSPFPVGLTVLNTNSQVKDAAGHICFVPVLDTDALSTVDRTKANNLVRQGCINTIIARIEAVAAVGFTCRLPDEVGVMHDRCCRPFLCAMQLDSKETYAYAGLRSERCCPWCRLRNGRSIFRIARPHNTDEIKRLWVAADAPNNSDERRQARARLRRHGWHDTRRCGLLDVADACLLPGPQGGGPLRGIIGVDVLHGIYQAWHGYLFDVLGLLMPTAEAAHRKALDAVVGGFVLRDPQSGKRLRRLTSLLGKEGLTAEKRVILLFLLTNGLGTSASVLGLPREVSAVALQCVSSCEIVFLACRNHRPYTEMELITIFEEQGVQFFAALEQLRDHADTGVSTHAHSIFVHSRECIL